MSNKNGDVGMSHLFRYEDIDGLVRFLQNRIGKKFQLRCANQSPIAELDLSQELRVELNEILAPDYEIYDRLRPLPDTDYLANSRTISINCFSKNGLGKKHAFEISPYSVVKLSSAYPDTKITFT